MKAYSLDLRIRIHNYSLKHTIRETGKVFDVSPDTVHLLRKLFIETGNLNPRKRSSGYPHLIAPVGETYLRLLLAEEVDLTLEELCNRYENTFRIRVSIATMYNTLERLNITRKKKTFSDPKKSTDEVKVKKEIYDKQLESVDVEKRFYLDETGSCLNMSPLYGRSFQGERVYDKRPTHPGKRVNTVAILTKEGIKSQYSYMGSLNAKVFIFYLATFVLPELINGQTLIMDNHPVHHAESVRDYLNQNKIKFLYIPPYSPDLNPIEEAFSKIKQFIKKQKARTIDRLLNVIQEALTIITPNDANGYFNHAAEF
jgi:transposase